MKRAKIFAAVIYAMLVMGTMTFVHFPDLRADEAQAKIGVEQAREAALRAVPGTVKDSDLETKHGRLVYSFEIERPGQHVSSPNAPSGRVIDVKVSAMDGSIVHVHPEHARNSRRAERCADIAPATASKEDLL